ncbi:50S ribosomal protein L22 [Helicobacter cetorum]|uniref:Large ribosomal subunit protein uL22 n=1 Tax=Helicobacter cetorum (strain ATCC BAA-429 / MIT 00-7128) TaxID=182217 RepID=I0EKG8_HELC0|nr:50S ribosomal protein L22 [Helicobacter cetorum]AFI03437.1 50S ribosomal protein L22 [Helicobacter cetorum MIT 00-7128]
MSRALLKFVRLSPTKARLIARQIQGMNAELAIASLEFTPNKAARVLSKVIASAVANGGLDAKNAVIISCRVDAGPVLRRSMPRAKGRATAIRKPTSHVLVVVAEAKESVQSSKSNKKTKVKGE